MRVRNLAVVGAAVVAAWAGSTGVAQATGGSDSGEPGCGYEELTSESGGWVPPAPIPCHPEDYPSSDAIAQVGCDDTGVLAVEATGLEPGVHVSLFVDSSRASSDDTTADEDGVAYLFAEFSPRLDGYVNYEVQYDDGNPAAFGEELVEDTCEGSATVTAQRDCATPETLSLALSASGLEPDTDYTVFYDSEGFQRTDGDGSETFVDVFTTDGSGNATLTSAATEDDEVSIADGAFSVDVEIYADDDLTTSVVGTVDVVACAAAGGTTPAPTTPAPTTPAPGTAAPVVVTHPAAAQPAVLANTGTPTASIALLGGGLLAAGAGAMVATRRRAS